MNVACTQCGSVSPPGNRFCGRCGTPLPPSPGNLPASARTSMLRPDAPAVSGVRAPCWQCGAAVDPLREPICANCGATLSSNALGAAPPVEPAPVAPAPPGPAPAAVGWTDPAPYGGYAPAGPTTAAPRAPRERLVSGPVFTIVAAIVIVLALAIAGIVAGQTLGP